MSARRVGHIDTAPLVWVLAAGCAAWLILVVGWQFVQWAAIAAAGLL